jgi:hypothetical protein
LLGLEANSKFAE